jgi:hypothetical protein
MSPWPLCQGGGMLPSSREKKRDSQPDCNQHGFSTLHRVPNHMASDRSCECIVIADLYVTTRWNA